ncbi:hypothetical protein P872_18450 [Rhodonellum psychrophilum GCM71 = DSM 17998]|uniref:Holin n=2 Tax=Rhodonellum TaxID=336827 RepID=U5BX07_9BACT|nr:MULTISPECIES: phage holin family protein [Rhodonellum]ERM82378.1 hypothetical protein P872_18450 [Rhodonellum psychrophilum GCM71 = DSM 17998]SDZ35487.1 Bacteriophage holin family protein [Rhodonellum ikkaensis]
MLFGYNSFNDLIQSTFKNVDTNLVIKFLIPIIIFIDIIFQFLFQSTNGIYFLMSLYIIDFFTGVAKSIMYSRQVNLLVKENKQVPEEIKNKVLVSKKFPRFLMTMLFALTLLSILKFAGVYVIVFSPLYSIFYAVFLGQQIISIVENGGEMKLIPFDVVKKLKQKINILKN